MFSLKTLIPIATSIIILSLVYSFNFEEKEIEVKGFVHNEFGYPVDKISLSVWKGEVKITSAKTDEEGKYSFSINDKGTYTIYLSENNQYYYTKTESDVDILPLKVARKDFVIEVNKQQLQHKTTRLREAYRHIGKNPDNNAYKGIYFKRFPSTIDELILFFGDKIKVRNLKKYTDQYLDRLYGIKLVSDTSYMRKLVSISRGCTEAKVIDPLKRMTSETMDKIKDNPKGFFDVLDRYNNEEVSNFVTFMIEQKMITKGNMPKNFKENYQYNSRIYSLIQKGINKDG